LNVAQSFSLRPALSLANPVRHNLKDYATSSNLLCKNDRDTKNFAHGLEAGKCKLLLTVYEGCPDFK